MLIIYIYTPSTLSWLVGKGCVVRAVLRTLFAIQINCYYPADKLTLFALAVTGIELGFSTVSPLSPMK